MTIDEQMTAICEWMPDHFDYRNIEGPKLVYGWCWRGSGNQVNWPTEGLQVCWLAESRLAKINETQFSRYCRELNRICCPIPCGTLPACGYTINATYEQKLEALSRSFFNQQTHENHIEPGIK